MLKKALIWWDLDFPVWSFDKTAVSTLEKTMKNEKSLTNQIQVQGHVDFFLCNKESNYGELDSWWSKSEPLLLQTCSRNEKESKEKGHSYGKIVLSFIMKVLSVKQCFLFLAKKYMAVHDHTAESPENSTKLCAL